MTRDQLLETADQLRQEIEARGFRIKYESGPVYYVVGIPAVSGTNAELAQKNAENLTQLDAWNVLLTGLWSQYQVVQTGYLSLVPIDNPWGSAGKPLPEGTTINYGDLFQRHQQAVDSQSWLLANDIARHINAITAAGPVSGGYVPVTGTDDQGNPITPGAGIVYSPEGIVAIPPPTVSGSIPPGPTSNIGDGPTTIPFNPNVTILPPTTASGGSGSSGSAIPQILPEGTMPVGVSPLTPATPAPAPNSNTMWLLLVAAVVVLYFATE